MWRERGVPHPHVVNESVVEGATGPIHAQFDPVDGQRLVGRKRDIVDQHTVNVELQGPVLVGGGQVRPSLSLDRSERVGLVRVKTPRAAVDHVLERTA